jgi:phosphatidylglycerol lysyltransferase
MPPASLPRARTLVMHYGWNATAYQILNPDMQHWFSREGNAVVGYVQHRHVRVVAGAPVCAEEQLAAVASEFEADARARGDRVCYVCAEGRIESLYRGREGYSRVLLGAQPVWNPQRWPNIIAHKASLRAQLNRARNKGVSIEEWPTAKAENDPGLHHCLEEWLNTRGLPALHFLVEPAILSRLVDRRVFVARRGSAVVGFLIASPIPERRGWLIEQNLRSVHAPNGTTELLLDVAVRTLANEGAEFVTLGLAPLSTKGHPEKEANPIWLRGLLAWLRAHGRRFYNFRGLEHFKAKFEPAGWDPVYAIVNERTFSPSTLYAIAAAFSNGSPITLFGRGLTKAIRTEIGWLFAERSD